MNNTIQFSECPACQRPVKLGHIHDCKATQPKQEWETEFDRQFDLDDYGSSHAMNDKVKQFIRSQLSLSNKELAGRIEGMKHHYTDSDKRKRAVGWNEACDKIISLLNQENI